MYFRHHRFFKCVGLEPCHYAINLNVESSVSVFSKLDYVFQSNVLLV